MLAPDKPVRTVCRHTLNNFVQVRDNLGLLLYIHVYIILQISKQYMLIA